MNHINNTVASVQSAVYHSPLGCILLEADEAGLTALRFLDRDCPESSPFPGPVLSAAAAWLDEYFAGKSPEPEFPLHLAGTPFQREVWKIIQSIPRGQTMTYGQIARQLAADRGITRMASQAVGQALSKNPVCLVIPCHRVLGSGGKLTGYAGGLERKKALLDLEGACIR